MPYALLTYALKETAFPRQSTGDQFFDHEQFDACRALGHFIGTAALAEGAEVEEDEQPEPPAQLSRWRRRRRRR
jgi:hypothetical protein